MSLSSHYLSHIWRQWKALGSGTPCSLELIPPMGFEPGSLWFKGRLANQSTTWIKPFYCFYTPPHNSGGVLRFHVGRPCIRPLSICPSVFLFPDDNLSKHQWIFTELGMCIDIVEIWFRIANGQISSNFYGVICPRHALIFVSRR